MDASKDLQQGAIELADEVFVLPASFAQQRLWFLDQFESNTTLYNILTAYRLSGALDLPALQQSLQAIVRRQESLRTTFAAKDGEPMQVVHGAMPVELSLTDISTAPEAEREAEVQRLIAAANLPFVLGRGPLFHFQLVRLSEQEHVLLVNLHHIIADGWSMGVFIRELAAFYEVFTGRRGEAGLAELPLQYADFSVWQRDWMQGEVLDEQLAYWKAKLGGELTVLQFPTDRLRQAKQTFVGKTKQFLLGQALSDGIKALCQKEGTTLNMALLAAFKTLLHRYTQLNDIVVGSPVAGRNQEETVNLIGFFVNTLVLRTDMSGTPTFRELLQRVRETTLEAIAHQDVPFEKLVEELAPERDLSRSPLIQLMFAYENFQTDAVQFADLSLAQLPVDTGVSKFDLTLFMGEAGQELYARVEYNTDLFDEATIDRLVANLSALLAGVVADPEQRISHLPVMSAAERQKLLVEWNDTTTDYWQGMSSLQEIFEAQVEQSPDRVALVFEQQTLTYRELNARANQLAHHLQKLGIGPEQMVGLALERSLEMIIGLLGIVKAGGAYVPLDPSYPQERLALMLEDADVSVLLTQKHLVQRFSAAQATVICLDADWERIAVEGTDNAAVQTQPESMLCLLYTSGSTGRPKGACILHRGVARLVRATNYMQYGLEEVFLQYSSISFDAAAFEIWGALLNGAKLVIYPPYKAALEELGQVIREHGITSMLLTTGLFHQMVDLNPDDLVRVRQLHASGDVASVLHAKKLFEKAPDWRFINSYGPTECTTLSTANWISRETNLDNSVPIGRAISNTTLYVLDRHLQPVPIGVPGELFIGGPGLARGYLNRPELTAEKFIPNPFAAEPDAKMYRTGDRVRFLPNGLVEYIARIDNLVKVRGFRVELGEIEVELRRHPTVRDAVVIVREDVPGDKRLVAYVLLEPGETTSTVELRNYLKSTLPEYMLPSAIVVMDVYPLNPNGKVDRKALPRPEYEATVVFVAPQSEEEAQMAAIWSSVLDVEQVGIHDNFFERGGHSLLATQAVSRLRKAFQVEIPLRVLFEYPTIAELAGWLAEQKKDAQKVPTMAARSREAFRKSRSTGQQD